MNKKLTQQIQIIEELEEMCPDAVILKLTPSRITIRLSSGSVVFINTK